jgi:hypothetical protein
VRTTDAVCLLRDTLAAVRLLRFETTADAGYVTTLIEKLIALDLPPPLAELTTRELLLCDLLLRWVLADAVTGASSVPSAAAEDFPPAPTQSEAAPTAADPPAAASGKETDEELSEEFVRGLPGPLQLMVAVERANSKREQRTGEPPVFELPARLLRDETTTDSLEDAE